MISPGRGMGYPVPVTDIIRGMTTTLFMRPRLALVALLAVVLAAASYAFAAANTVPGSTAGSGTGAVSGYTASSVSYTLNTDPSKVDAITFTLSPTSTSAVKVKYTNAGSWSTCTNDGSGHITCDYSGSPIALSAIDNLTIVAVS